MTPLAPGEPTRIRAITTIFIWSDNALSSERTSCAQRQREKALALVEGVAGAIFEWNEWTTRKLQDELRRQGLPIYGTKAEKRNRLIAFTQGRHHQNYLPVDADKNNGGSPKPKNANAAGRAPDFKKH